MSFSILIIIILVCVAISMKGFNDEGLREKFTFSPFAVKHHNEGLRTLTHMWIHVDYQHLIFNMLSLYFLGDLLLKEFMFYFGNISGQINFLVLYLLGGLFATAIPYLRNRDNPGYRSMGASGAVSAIVFAAILWRPDIELGLFLLPFRFPAYWFGIIYLAYEFWADKKGGTGIAHDAHIGGAIFGIIYILVANSSKGIEFINYLVH
jgi:membrane associated rhomboid family serine protease